MIVGIDVSVAVTPPLSGVGYHIARLVEHLVREAPPDIEFRLFFNRLSAATGRQAAQLFPASSRIRHVSVPYLQTKYATVHRAYWNWMLPASIRWHGCSVFHGPAHILPRLSRIPSVVTIHDLAPFDFELYEKAFSTALRDAVLASMNRATRIIALSQHTRAHVERLTGRSSDVRVIYGAGNYATEATREIQTGDQSVLSGLGIRGRYLLYVGDYNPRKNVPYLIKSFALLARQEPFADLQLVLAGNSQKARSSLELEIQAAGLDPGKVVFTGRVSDEVLPVLYRNAAAFSLCSLLEGFTLVTLEAMSYGVPVVATATSSIAEGTGDAAELVPLDQPEAVARALAVAISPGPRRDEMRRVGLERVQHFTWKANAIQTLEVYAEAAAVNPAAR